MSFQVTHWLVRCRQSPGRSNTCFIDDVGKIVYNSYNIYLRINSGWVVVTISFLCAFVAVLSILVFSIYLHEGKLKGKSAVFMSIIVAFICSVSLFFFVAEIVHGFGNVVAN